MPDDAAILHSYAAQSFRGRAHPERPFAFSVPRIQLIGKLRIQRIPHPALLGGIFLPLQGLRLPLRRLQGLLSRGFAPLDLYMEQALAGHGADAPPEQLWRILSSYAAFIEALGWELVARYYQRRLDSPDDASSMDPTRYTLRAMLDCLHQAEAQGILLPGQSVEWTADFFFRHFRGVVVDWVLHRGSYPLLPRLEQDYALFQNIFQV